MISSRKKWQRAPPTKGTSSKLASSGEGEDPTLLARSSQTSNKTPKVIRAPYLNPDAFRRFIGPKNLIDDELTTCLLDNGAQLNFVTPSFAQERRMDVMSMDCLAQEVGRQVPPI